MQNQAIAQIKRYYSEREKSDSETFTTITSDPDPASMVAAVLIVLTLYWSVRGKIGINWGVHLLPDDNNLILFVIINSISGIKGVSQSVVLLAMRT